ncbi:uncharacterized protein ACN427_010946 [Glossina fuscipes fuscipes]
MSYNQKPPGPGGSGMGGGPPNGPNNVQQAAQTFAAGIQQMQNFVHGQNALPQSSQSDLNAFLQQQRIQTMLKQQQQFIHFQQMQQQQKQQQQHHNMTGGGVGGVVSGAGGGSGEPLALTRTPGAADLLHKTYQQQANGNPSANSPLNQLQQQLQQALHFQFQMHNQAKLHQQQHAQGGNQGQHHGQQQSNQGPLSSQQQQQQKLQQQQNPLSTVAGLQHLQQRYITAAQAVASGNKLSSVTPPPPPPPPLTNQMKPPNLPPNTQITPVAGTTVGPNVPGSNVHPKSLSSATMSAMGSGKRVAQTPPPSISLTPAKQNSPSPGTAHQQNKFQTAGGTSASGKASIGSASPLSSNYAQNFQKHPTPNSGGTATTVASPSKVGANVDAAGTALKSPQSTPVQLTKQTPPTTPTPPITTTNKTNINATITNTAPTTTAPSSAPFATTLVSPQKSSSTPTNSNSSEIKINTKSTPLAGGSTINDSKPIDKEVCKVTNNNGPETSATGCLGPNKKDANKGKSPPEKTREASPKMSPSVPAVIAESETANKNEVKTATKKTEVDVITKKPTLITSEEGSKLKQDENGGDKKCNDLQDDLASSIKTTVKPNAEMTKTPQTADPTLKNDDACKSPPKVPSSAIVSEKITTEEQKRLKDSSIVDRVDFSDDVEKSKNGETSNDNETQNTENPKTNISIIKDEVKPISNTAVDTALTTSPISRSSEKGNYLSGGQSLEQDTPSMDAMSTSPTSTKATKFSEKKSVLPSPDKGSTLEDRINDIKLEANNTEKEESKKVLKTQEFSSESIKVGISGKINKNNDGKEANNASIKNETLSASTTTASETVLNTAIKKMGRQSKTSKANKTTISAATTTTTTSTTTTTTNEKVKAQGDDKPIATGRAKRKSKVESYAIDSSVSATSKAENITPSADRKSQRHRLKTILYQSPLPELAYITKLSASEASNSPKPMSSEDRLIVFYKNEYMAVRNAEGTFYLCQTMQNVYRTSPRISIRWLSEDSKDPNIYVPDFYDHTDIECVLTTVELKRIDKGHMRLPKSEKTRIESILKKALDVEKGIAPRPELTEENPDGLDISLYKDESQIEKKPPVLAAGSSNGGHETPFTTSGRKSRRGGIGNVIPKYTTTIASSHNVAETSAPSTVKSSKRKRASGVVSLLAASSNIRKSSNKKRKPLKRKRKQKSTSSDDDDDQESSDDLESDTDYKPNQKRSTFNASASKATPRAQRSPLAKARAASPITPTTSRAKNVPQESTPTPSTSKITATTRGERASKRKAADVVAEDSIIVKKSVVSSSTVGPTTAVIATATATATAAAASTSTSTTPTTIANTKPAATTNNNKNKSSESASSIESSVNSGFALQKKNSDNKMIEAASVTSTNNTSFTSTNNNNNNNNCSTPLLIVPNISTSSPQTENTGTAGNNSGNNGSSAAGNRSTRSRK